jgi:PTH1 family peptidyl-tRNA hydrolase
VWAIVGLGNPGPRYHRTPHNVGFRVVDRLAARWGVELAREAHGAILGEARPDASRVLLVKPLTFMNRSGKAVASLRRYYPLEPARIVAVQDDLDGPVGRVRIRVGGGAGGHRGITSLIDVLGEPGFPRVKVGIGRPPAGVDAAAFVLAPMDAGFAATLAAAETRAAEAVELLVAEGPERAMNRINQREALHGGSPL